MEFADKNEWTSARQEWDGVLSDIEGGMIELKSTQLAQLVSRHGCAALRRCLRWFFKSIHPRVLH